MRVYPKASNSNFKVDPSLAASYAALQSKVKLAQRREPAADVDFEYDDGEGLGMVMIVDDDSLQEAVRYAVRAGKPPGTLAIVVADRGGLGLGAGAGAGAGSSDSLKLL